MQTSFLARPLISGRRVVGPACCASSDIRTVYTLIPRPFPSLVALVPKRHVAVLERFGKFCKRLDNGVHFIFPFVERISACYKDLYDIEGIEDYEVGGTLKIKIDDDVDDVVWHGEKSSINKIVGDAIGLIGEEILATFKNGGVVNAKLNKQLEDRINGRLADEKNGELADDSKVSFELKMLYVKPLSHNCKIERRKELMKGAQREEEKREDKREKIVELAKKLALTCVLLAIRRIDPKEARDVIEVALDILISLALLSLAF